MGVFTVEIEIGDPDGQRFERLEAVVDTGATYTVVPAARLRRLGVVPSVSSPFELADGTMRDFDIGQTQVRVDGQEVTTLVVFGEDQAEPLLGAYTLGGLRLASDPVRRRLFSVPGRLAYASPIRSKPV